MHLASLILDASGWRVDAAVRRLSFATRGVSLSDRQIDGAGLAGEEVHLSLPFPSTTT